MNRQSTTRRGLVLAAVFGVVCAMAPVAAISPAAAVPGFPGVPQDPPGINEGFQTQVGAGNGNAALPIQVYTHLDVATGTQMPYSADQAWTAPAPGQNGKDNCNGWVLNYYSPTAGGNCGSATNSNGGRAYVTKTPGNNPAASTYVGQSAWWFLKGMAVVIGAQNGMADPRLNNVVASQTTTDPQLAGYQFKADNVVKTQAGHYYAVAVDFAEAHCPNQPGGLSAWYDARESLALVVDGTAKWMFGDGTAANGISICNSGTLVYVPQTGNGSVAPSDSLTANNANQNTNSWLNNPYYFMHMVSLPVQTATPQNLGLQIYNARAQFSGNDVAFDNIEIVDVTPQMDKAFKPGTISAGQTATLTFTMTNTTDLHKKDGWHFTDTLQPGLTVVPGSEKITGCDDATFTGPATDGGPGGPNGKITVSPDGTTIDVQGNLAEGVAYCTATVEVTSTIPGTYSNGCSEVSDLWGLNPPGVPVDPQDPTQCVPPNGDKITVETHPHLTLAKSADPTTVTTAGQKVTYSITITNDGDVPVANLALDDSVFSGKGTLNNDLSCTPVALGGTLDPLHSVGNKTYTGATSTTCTVSYNATQADIDAAATIDNSATASGIGLGTNPGGADYPVTSNTDSAHVTITPTPKLALTKSANPATVAAAGQSVTYSFVVQNTGNVTMKNLSFQDGAANSYVNTTTPGFSGTNSLSAVTCPTAASAWQSGVVGSLRPNDTITCTATYTVSQADIDKGAIKNTATVKGDDPNGTTATSNPSPATVNVTRTPSLLLNKSVTPNGTLSANELLTYSFHVTNTGNVTLTGLSIDDSGPYVNDTTPGFNGTGGPLTVTCPTAASAWKSGVAGTLRPLDDITCTATYTVTQADVNRGVVNNAAVATANDPDNVPVPSNPDHAKAPATQEPEITLTKTDSASGAIAAPVAGQSVTYYYLLKNTGNVTLSNVAVTDPMPGLTAIACPATAAAWPSGTLQVLNPNQSVTCMATYTLTQADIDHGSLQNTATATGDPPTGDPVTDTKTDTVTLAQVPALTVTKSATETSYSADGQTIHYSFVVKNTGDVSLTNPSVAETAATFSGTGTLPAPTCPPIVLKPGESVTCTATYTTTLPDVNAGQLVNTAKATATPPPGIVDDLGQPVTSVSATSNQVVIPATQIPHLAMVKSAAVSSADNTKLSATTDTVTYSFQVTNDGNVTVNNIEIRETAFSGTGTFDWTSISCVKTSLDPGESTTCTAPAYTVTQADLNSTKLSNTAKAVGNDPLGFGVESLLDTKEVPTDQVPHLSLVKSAAVSSADNTKLSATTDTVTYSFAVTNDGNVTVSNIAIDETAFSGTGTVDWSAISCDKTSLDPGQSATCTASAYSVTLADLNTTKLSNTAKATGKDPTGGDVNSDPKSVDVLTDQQPKLTLLKSASPTTVAVKDTPVVYSFEVTNDGNVTVDNIAIDESSYSFSGSGTFDVSAITCTPTTLKPGEKAECTAPNYLVTQTDIDSGSILNTAKATGTDPSGEPVVSDPSPATVGVTSGSSLAVAKSASPTTVSTVGAQVTYSFVVTNNGNQTVHSIAINESAFSGTGPIDWTAITCEKTTLAPTETTTCTAPDYAVTLADLNAGKITNTANATGKDPTNGDVVSPDDSKTVDVTQTPHLAIAKSVTPTTVAAEGDTVVYKFDVTNDGNVTVHGIAINESAFSGTGTPDWAGITCVDTTLDPGASTTCTAPAYAVTQADINAGTITNTANATGKGPITDTHLTGVDVQSAPDHATVTATQTPHLSLVKSAAVSSADNTKISATTDTVTYSFTVTNDGNVTVSSVAIDETAFSGSPAIGPITCVKTSLDPGESTTCSAPPYAVTQADLNSSALTNTAKATGKDPTGGDVNSDPKTVNVPTDKTPHLSLVKSAAVDSADNAKISATTDTVTYSFTVTNDGNVTVSSVAIDETAFSGSPAVGPITCVKTSLDPGESTTCTAPPYHVTQADLNSTKLSNTAKATGKDPTGGDVNSDPKTVDVLTDQTPHLSMVKSAAVSSADNAKLSATTDTVTYSFVVTNDGNVTVSSIAIDETAFSGSPAVGPITCAKTSLDPGESTTCSAPPYAVTQADLNSTKLSNTAKATGKDPTGGDVNSDPKTVDVLTDQAPHLSLVKSAAVSSADNTKISAATDTVTYSFTVTNDGNVTVSSVAIDETAFSGSPAIGPITCVKTSLDPGDSTTCTAPPYHVTLADLNTAKLSNTAKATGKDPTGGDVNSDPKTVDVPTDQQPHLSLVKSAVVASADNTKLSATTDTVTYSFVVTNDGNVTVSNIAIDETAFSGTGTVDWSAISCDKTSLDPGQSATCTASAYSVTLADLNTTKLSNTAKATGKDPSGGDVNSDPKSVDVLTDQQPKLTLLKSASPTTVAVKDTPVVYSFEVTNDGNVTVDNVAIDESSYSFSGSGTFDVSAITCTPTTLKPGEKAECTAPNYLVTQTDIDSGSILNTAKATGSDPSGGAVTSNPSSATVDVTAGPSLSVAKSATPTTVSTVGAKVTYSFVVTNNGNVTVHGIAINESAFSGTGTIDWSAISCDKTTLAPTQTATCVAPDYSVTLADLNAGKITNTASATGKDPSGGDVISPDDSKTVTATQTPHLAIAKSATPATVAAEGDAVVYSFEVTNDGNVTVHGIAINESAFSGTGTPDWAGITCDATTLDPGASTTCTAPAYAVTQADINAGTITNTANATGKGPITDTHPTGVDVSSDPDNATVTATQSPALTIVKTATPTSVTAANQTVAYTFKVTNTGNVTVKNITIDEKTFTGKGTVNWAGITCDKTTLLPGDWATCTAPLYAATQQDMDTLSTIDNTATAKGSTNLGTAVESTPDDAQVTVNAAAALTLVKSANPNTQMPAVGGTIQYSFLVTNTGTQTVSGIQVADIHFDGAGTLGTPSCPKTTLVPGDFTTCTVSYTVQQEDVDAGVLNNTAQATGSDPKGGGVTSNESSAQVPEARHPHLTLSKPASPTTVSLAGQTVNYLFQVTNDGNVTIKTITINETSFTGTNGPLSITCPTTPLLPGATANCTATYTITLDDMNAGVVTNTAHASGLSPSNATVDSNADDATVTALQDPKLSLVKTATPTTVTAAGQTVNYKFVVTNTGNVTIDHVAIDDSSATFSGKGTFDQTQIHCDVVTLKPNESANCTIPYTAVQQDIDAGGTIDNTAKATGDDPKGNTVLSQDSDAHVQVTQSPALTLQKTAAVHSGAAKMSAAGDQIDNTFTVKNTGNVTVKGITIADGGAYSVGGTAVGFSGAGTMSQITCDATTLAPDATTTCHATYNAMQDDIDAGGIYNTAKASATTDTAGPVDSNLSTAQVLSDKMPALQITKTHDAPPATPMKGDTVTFRFTVTNNGNVTIKNETVTDVLTGHGMTAVTCEAGAASMAPNASVNCSAVYTLTQDDIDAGFVDNPTAQASGRAVGATSDTLSNIASDHVPLAQKPALTLQKSVAPDTVTKPGNVAYAFLVTNTGNVTVHAITIDETQFTGSNGEPDVSCPDTVLAPGDQTICTATYAISQTDIDRGVVNNTATANGISPETVDNPQGVHVASDESSAAVTATQTAALSLVKTGTPSTEKDLKVGTVITYSFVVTNTGNVTMTSLRIEEQKFTGSNPLTPPTCPTNPAAWTSGQVGTLAPGEKITCTTTYRVTQKDVDAGSIINTAVAKGIVPLTMWDRDGVTDGAWASNTSTFPETLDQTSTVGLVKTGVLSGSTITWTYVVTNTGVTNLTDLKLTEAQFSGHGATPVITCPKTTLAPAEKMTCTAVYQVVAADKGTDVANNGQVDGLGANRTIPVRSNSIAKVSVPADPPAPVVQTGGSISSSSIWPYAVAGALVLVGLAVVGFFLWRRRRDETTPAAPESPSGQPFASGETNPAEAPAPRGDIAPTV